MPAYWLTGRAQHGLTTAFSRPGRRRVVGTVNQRVGWQARIEGLTLVTADARIADYDVLLIDAGG